MSKKIVNVLVEYTYTLEVDENNPVVKDYDSTEELVQDCASYRFMVLPVMGNGVRILDATLVDCNIMPQPKTNN